MQFWQRIEEPAQVLVAGASRGIGLALTTQLLERAEVAKVFAVARHAPASADLLALQVRHGSRLQLLACDLRNEAAVAALASQLLAQTARLHLLLCSVGILQEDAARAEKSLTQLSLEGLMASFNSNCFAPILLLKHLLPLLRGKHPCSVAALSARVGSIGDNRLGGWYSYRASKAALNQLLHTASIELKRLNPQSCVLSLHPGTTDTELSRPFQAKIAADSLFSPEFAARCLLQQVAEHGPEDSGSFWAWDGQQIPW
ncbi:SDR family NAD(P)-dependent oxidoreductase [Aquipseudomonas alcaligenes]|uniref:NAD(P)-dependent dehydrogenase, short-chain alcohol dehydrogenase family n=1 Tax=Aquipseudomonas alcaligenes TaxID=43263 RepID=A0A1N6NTE5_AQUAC|nr:SDR family NAD(P)-dependent oxidoreductase [Pseudomonas alcaligenes]SIP95364.1 NAD(P)-dependent dehydrogenase, short-chain alcohol dehydrogenase family [Pseudomonas alcaligenes]